MMLSRDNFIIVSLYRSPDTNLDSFLKTLESLLIFLNKKHKSSKLAITSDFNVNILKKSPETNALLYFEALSICICQTKKQHGRVLAWTILFLM